MNNWEQISSIVDRALDLNSNERLAFVEDICADDQLLKANVIHFLDSIQPSENLWEKMVESSGILVNEITSSHVDIDSSPLFSPLKQAGPYRVIELIARGGMGNVYLAERSDGQFERTVAIKILRHELSSKNHVERFSAERNILSGLEHPNIARLYDGGLTADNRPYLVMEYVNGVPITTYCIENRCTLKEILDLFKQVCKAVEYAHRNLIVHRDLKPDNILVKPDGTVKILDFGIAKILDEELTPEKRVQTKENLHLLSIQYAAPEQVTLEKITTATDVYALGLLLYEMITGRPPFDLKGKKLEEAEILILNELPEKPSQKAGSSTLSGKLKGDLDAIILKALNKKSENRYTSVDQFLDDIQQYQSGRPVSACQNTFNYRAQKFITRRPGAVLAVLAVVVAIVGYLVTLQLHAESLKIERDKAELESNRAGLISGFLVDLFESADPIRSPGNELSAKDLLDQGVERIHQLDDQPLLQSMITLTMARAYHSLGLYDDALPLVDQILVSYEERGDFHSITLAEALEARGLLLQAKGDYDLSEMLLRESLIMRLKLFGEEHIDVARAKNNLGALLKAKGNLDAAEHLYKKSLALRRKILGDEHPDIARAINNLGTLLKAKGDYDTAESLYHESLAMRRKLLGEEHPEVAMSINNLGVLLRAKGDYDAAEPLFYESLSIRRKHLGSEHPDVARAINNLGALLRSKGDYDAAEPLYREALAMQRRLLGEEHPNVAISINNLGSLLHSKGDYDAAESLYRESLAMRRKLLGGEHPSVAISINNLGALLREKGDYEAAEPLYRKALAMHRSLFGDEHPRVAGSLNSLGLLLYEKGELDAAEHLLSESLEMRQRLLGEEHPHIANTLNHLGRSILAKGDLLTAEELFYESLDMRRRLLGEQHPGTAASYESLYMLFLEQGEYEKALSKLRNALDIRLKTLGDEHPDVITTQKQIEKVVSKIERNVNDSE